MTENLTLNLSHGDILELITQANVIVGILLNAHGFVSNSTKGTRLNAEYLKLIAAAKNYQICLNNAAKRGQWPAIAREFGGGA